MCWCNQGREERSRRERRGLQEQVVQQSAEEPYLWIVSRVIELCS
jgi:hypothetical protein